MILFYSWHIQCALNNKTIGNNRSTQRISWAGKLIISASKVLRKRVKHPLALILHNLLPYKVIESLCRTSDSKQRPGSQRWSWAIITAPLIHITCNQHSVHQTEHERLNQGAKRTVCQQKTSHKLQLLLEKWQCRCCHIISQRNDGGKIQQAGRNYKWAVCSSQFHTSTVSPVTTRWPNDYLPDKTKGW